MTKMQAAVSSASMMIVNLSLRRSRRLLASSQALACSTTQRTVPRPEPCGSPLSRISGRMPSLAKLVVVGAVIGRIGIEPGDGGADHQSAAQQGGKQHRVVHVGGGRQGGQRNAVTCHDEMILGAPLAAICRVWPGQLTAALGAHAAAVDDDIQRR